ncbi:MAG: DUF2723 domain-containing protein, partial [Chitinivibrionales bacterium]|nr:DUF2723 domain-containing protein [Chitinivibrionales bacterium]MBD3356189.1 DUF2723 domain-containing protein [Chitinivibrionales bacterium]
GALFAAFGYTFWFSAVEASVYVPTMLFISVCTWLVLKWAQSPDEDRDRYLVLIAYLVFLSIGVHMMGMLAMAPVGLFVFLYDRDKIRDWRLWFIGIMMASVIWQPSMFLVFGPLLVIMAGLYAFLRFNDARYINAFLFGIVFLWRAVVEFRMLRNDSIAGGTFVENMIPYMFVFAFTIVELFADEGAVQALIRRKWRFLFWLIAYAILGYSVHIYIPIRSALNPIIDENHPVVTWEDGRVKADNFRYFLERKQYGSESMITRMFWRRGAWTKQFGIDDHMGYGGFHLTQFFHFGRSIDVDRTHTVFQNWGTAGGLFRLLLYLVPTFLMIFGWRYLYKRNKNMAILMISLVLLSSVGLVLYMNFADGHHAEKRDYMAWVQNGRQGEMPTVHREVRIRDYFFTPGFMFYGMWLGIAAGCLLHALFTHKNSFLRTRLAPILVVLFAVSPVLPLTQNYAENQRGGDWVPYDYAYNLLMSCEKDGILFTNGDNDTFPLWFLQEARGIRRDVRIVNLSLLNTLWYIKQLKDLEPKVPISYTHKQIETKLRHSLNPFPKSFEYELPGAGITVIVPGQGQKHAMRIQDQMVLNIVDSNRWKKPIYFAVTVSDANLMGLQPYLQMQGLVYRVHDEVVPREERVDIDKTLYMLDQVYQFRGLGNGEAPLSETTRKLMSNYAASFIQVSLALQRSLDELKTEIAAKESSAADSLAKEAAVGVDAELAALRTRYETRLNTVINKLDQCVSLMPWDWRPRMLRQEILLANERYDLALKRIREARRIEPDKVEYLQMEAQLLEKMGRKAEANKVYKNLVATEPDPWAAYLRMAANYRDLGMYDSAIDLMR